MQVLRPASVRAAAEALSSDPGARLLGGGTLVVRASTAGDLSIGKWVLSDDLGLSGIAVAGGRASLGSGVTMAAVLAEPALWFLHPVASEIGGPAVRAMATVGGNLFAPSPYGDFAVALLALGAQVSVQAAAESEDVDLEAFLQAREAYVRHLVLGVSFAMPSEGAFRFLKVTRRHPHGASVLSIAACVPLQAGNVKGARIAYGAMAPSPVRAHSVEGALEGKPLDAGSIAAAIAAAGDGTAPASDPFASAWYRASVLPVHLARLLKTMVRKS